MKEIFIQLLQKYTSDQSQINEWWIEIEKAYSNKKRHYHSLTHLQHLFQQLTEVKNEIKDWDTILFTLYYHDLVYNTLKQDNEEQSAELAGQRMKQVGIPHEKILVCKEQILATKSHVVSDNSDTNYFTDADLSVLGADWDTYQTYFKNIRKEYSIYPSIVYNPGRKKVLQHFLAMPRIFKTEYFFHLYEQQAKTNLHKELNQL
jgi:predicted metal-dependent HD superfamily phosphohydrolase